MEVARAALAPAPASESAAAATAVAADAPSRATDFLELTKPRITALVLVTAAVGYAVGTPGAFDTPRFVLFLIGTALLCGGASALNQFAERDADAKMARTSRRPIPAGRLRPEEALRFGLALCVTGLAALAGVNLPTLLLGAASVLSYVLAYTPLKRRTTAALLVGAVPGAAPPLLGWVAVTGQADPGALALFLIILVWTPPHFWALAIHRRDEYARAAIPMLPVTHGVAFTCGRILFYAVLLWAVSLLPFAIGIGHGLYLAGACVLGARFVERAWRLRGDERFAMPTFRYSIVYLAALFALLLLDHWLSGAS